MSTKRKRVDLDFSSKMDIIKLIDAKSKRKDIADKYGIDVSTISKFYKNREKITKDFHSSLLAADCKRMRTSVYTDVEEALLKWFKTLAAQLPISGPMLAEIAESLAKEMGLHDWKCSNGFLERFKNVITLRSRLQQERQPVLSKQQLMIGFLVCLTSLRATKRTTSSIWMKLECFTNCCQTELCVSGMRNVTAAKEQKIA